MEIIENRYFTYEGKGDAAVGKAVAEIDRRVMARAAEGLHIDRSVVRGIAKEVLAPVFKKHRKNGVTDSEPLAAISDRLDEILEKLGMPQPSWESYDLTLGG